MPTAGLWRTHVMCTPRQWQKSWQKSFNAAEMIVFRHVNGWKSDVRVAAKTRDESVPKVVMMFTF